jgi:hypothetical protein
MDMVVICLSFVQNGSSNSLATREPPEVCPLIKWDDVAFRLNPYPSHYRTAFAFSGFLYPHFQQLASRLARPKGRKYGLTLFPLNDQDGLDPASPPVAVASA